MQLIRFRVSRMGIALAFACAAAVVLGTAAFGQGRLKWQYTALGDSLAVGVLALRGYVPRYQEYMQDDTGAHVSLRNLAQNGWTSADLLTALRTDASFRRSVRGSQVVTWDIGGNDFRSARESYKNGTCGTADDNEICLRNTLAAFTSNWDGIVVEILALRSASTTIIRTMDMYNPYVAEDKEADTDLDGTKDFYELKPYVDLANQHIAQSLENTGILMAKVYAAFNGADGTEDPNAKGYISSDGLHPNDAGHRAIADEFRKLDYLPLSNATSPSSL